VLIDQHVDDGVAYADERRPGDQAGADWLDGTVKIL
jgi:hypothetical protein